MSFQVGDHAGGIVLRLGLVLVFILVFILVLVFGLLPLRSFAETLNLFSGARLGKALILNPKVAAQHYFLFEWLAFRRHGYARLETGDSTDRRNLPFNEEPKNIL